MHCIHDALKYTVVMFLAVALWMCRGCGSPTLSVCGKAVIKLCSILIIELSLSSQAMHILTLLKSKRTHCNYILIVPFLSTL